MDRNLQILGLANKAGLLAVGGEAAGTAARSGKTKLIISANDASEGAHRRARTSAEAGYALHIISPYTKYELGSVVRRGAPGTLAVLDAGLAARFMKGLAEIYPDHYGGAARMLADKARDLKESRKQAAPGRRRTTQ